MVINFVGGPRNGEHIEVDKPYRSIVVIAPEPPPDKQHLYTIDVRIVYNKAIYDLTPMITETGVRYWDYVFRSFVDESEPVSIPLIE